MIPKTIHYCWVGKGKLSQLADTCLMSWKKFCPDWTVKRWDENNIPINQFKYLKTAYKNKKFANVSNLARLYAIYNEGGIYLDVDVELIKNIDMFLSESCFFSFELLVEYLPGQFLPGVNNAIMGAAKYHPFVKEMMDELLFKFDGLEEANLSSPHLTTNLLLDKGLDKNEQVDGDKVKVGEITVFPKRYFHPYKHFEKFSPECVKPDTYGIHRFQKNWEPKEKRITFKKIVKKILGK